MLESIIKKIIGHLENNMPMLMLANCIVKGKSRQTGQENGSKWLVNWDSSKD